MCESEIEQNTTWRNLNVCELKNQTHIDFPQESAEENRKQSRAEFAEGICAKRKGYTHFCIESNATA